MDWFLYDIGLRHARVNWTKDVAIEDVARVKLKLVK